MRLDAALRGALILAAAPANASVAAERSFTPERYVAFGIQEMPSSDAGTEAAVHGRLHDIEAGFGAFEFGHGKLAVGLDYRYTRFEYDGIASRDRDLHRLAIPLVWRGESAESRLSAIEFALTPTIATSSNVFQKFWDRGSREDIYLGGRLAVELPAGPWTWHLGAAADRLWGSSSVYPIVGGERRFGKRWHARLVLPFPEVEYRLSHRHGLALAAEPAGYRWHVVSDDFTADFDYRLRAFRTTASWEFKAYRRWAVSLSAGFETGREHRFADDMLEAVDVAVDDGWVYGLRLEWTR